MPDSSTCQEGLCTLSTLHLALGLREASAVAKAIEGLCIFHAPATSTLKLRSWACIWQS